MKFALRFISLFAGYALVVAGYSPRVALAGGLDVLDERLARAFSAVSPSIVPGGILLDRAVTLSNLDRFDGSTEAPAATSAVVRQIVHELRRASLGNPLGPAPEEIRERGRQQVDGRPIPIVVVDANAARVREEATRGGTLRIDDGRIQVAADDLRLVPVFAAAPVVDASRRGAALSFVLEPGLWTSWGRPAPARIALDLADGRGFRDVRFGEPAAPANAAIGRREFRVRAEWADGEVRIARFGFDIVRMGTPAPTDTLDIVATVPYGGIAGTGKAYVDLAPGHSSITNPVVVIEGFDLDDSMSWEKLYELLNQENLLEELRALGFDAIVLDFDSATDPIQRNAFVVAELLQQVASTIDPSRDVFLVGASMGGLCARFALAWLESQSIDPRVRTFLSFDVPHAGANVPLGIQYWLDFFSSESVDAAFLLSRLDTPAARQMLVAHHTSPPGSTGVPDPLRATLLSDFAALGNWPAAPRLAAVSNGSGSLQNQGFAPSAQIIQWEYRSFWVDIDGNVWAVPNSTSANIFYGQIDFILLPADEQTVNVSGTPSWDNAPGGSRDSMFQMDTTAAPYGDIVALHDRHCFIPTISALALDTADLFFDVAGASDLLEHTPFDAVRWAPVNEEHVFISPETKAWILDEIEASATSAPLASAAAPSRVLRLDGVFPIPARDGADVSIRFAVGKDAPVEVEVVDVAGRRVARLLKEAWLSAGPHTLRWRPEAPGVYFVRLRALNERISARVAALE